MQNPLAVVPADEYAETLGVAFVLSEHGVKLTPQNATTHLTDGAEWLRLPLNRVICPESLKRSVDDLEEQPIVQRPFAQLLLSIADPTDRLAVTIMFMRAQAYDVPVPAALEQHALGWLPYFMALPRFVPGLVLLDEPPSDSVVGDLVHLSARAEQRTLRKRFVALRKPLGKLTRLARSSGLTNFTQADATYVTTECGLLAQALLKDDAAFDPAGAAKATPLPARCQSPSAAEVLEGNSTDFYEEHVHGGMCDCINV